MVRRDMLSEVAGLSNHVHYIYLTLSCLYLSFELQDGCLNIWMSCMNGGLFPSYIGSIVPNIKFLTIVPIPSMVPVSIFGDLIMIVIA